jgi:hypothetical protein
MKIIRLIVDCLGAIQVFLIIKVHEIIHRQDFPCGQVDLLRYDPVAVLNVQLPGPCLTDRLVTLPRNLGGS